MVALVRSAHGLRGAVRVEILTDHPELRYAAGSVLHREGSSDALTVDWAAAVGDGPGWRLHFAEVTDRAGAEALRGAYLETVVGPEAELGRGEYFWHEVVGVTVSNVDGTVLGTVRDIYRTGGAEVFVVDGGTYGEFDVPVVRAFIRVFAPRRGEIVIDAEALDLTPPKPKGDRPKAPRRRSGPRRRTTAAAGDTVPDRGDSPPDGDSVPDGDAPLDGSG